MKQLMELLGLDIPKWEGPTICESSTRTSECADVKAPKLETVDAKVKKEERKREAEALTDTKEEVSLKKEKSEPPEEDEENRSL